MQNNNSYISKKDSINLKFYDDNQKLSRKLLITSPSILFFTLQSSVTYRYLNILFRIRGPAVVVIRARRLAKQIYPTSKEVGLRPNKR